MIKGHAPLLTTFKELQFHTELVFGIFSMLRETRKIVFGILFFFCIFFSYYFLVAFSKAINILFLSVKSISFI